MIRPKTESMTQAAVMGTAWLTAYRMLFVKSGLRPGQTMLVQGASGGVATALVQLGRAAGMQVWVTGRSDAKRAVAERLGADATFPSGARLPARVDAVFETVGEATWAHSMRALKPGGLVLVNTGDEPDHRHVARLHAGLAESSPHTAAIAEADVWKRRRHGNVVLLASDRPLPLDTVIRNVARIPFPSTLREGAALARALGGGQPFTDADAQPSPAPQTPPGSWRVR